ncbi:hypothetical protein EV356DRAFT_458285, partial [Viridothelium virens]
WFNAVALQVAKHKYHLLDMYNINKLGFSIKEEQTIIVLIHLNNIKKKKVVLNKQDWVTNIKCISAAGKLLAPLLVFKGDHINT